MEAAEVKQDSCVGLYNKLLGDSENVRINLDRLCKGTPNDEWIEGFSLKQLHDKFHKELVSYIAKRRYLTQS